MALSTANLLQAGHDFKEPCGGWLRTAPRVSLNLNSLKGLYGEYVRESFRLMHGDTRSLDYGLCARFKA